MTVLEHFIVLFIATLFLVALCAIVLEEKEEADIYKIWEKWK